MRRRDASVTVNVQMRAVGVVEQVLATRVDRGDVELSAPGFVTAMQKINSNSYEGTIMPLKFAKLCTALVLMLIVDAAACAADVTVTPAAGSGLVVKDAAGVNERLRVQESGAITLPGVPGAAAQSTGVCISSAGLLGPCGGGTTYTAATGLALTGTAFSVAPTYQLPQGCSANQFAQWSGSAWACANASGGAALPTGTFDQTLRFNSANTLVANSMLLTFADGGLLAGGTSNVGSIPETGAGTRMMWYPKKDAFRAGRVGGTEWDDANVGDGSIAAGVDTKASGNNSVAMGSFTTASGTTSTAMGAATTASGVEAVALGDTTIASGTGSTAMGLTTTASGDFSTAMGNGTTAGGKSSTAMGHSTVASGYASTAIGENVTASGDNSIAMGSLASTNGHANSFVWSDGSISPNLAQNDANGQFLVTAAGGVKFTSYLEVDGTNTISTWYDYFGESFTGPVEGECRSCPSHASVYAPNGYILAVEFDALSDRRIKEIAGISDSARDVATLNAIEVTDYTMKDKARYGNRPQKKVVAQQVEQVFPQLVTKHTDFIPDVYKATNHIDKVDGGYKLDFDTPHGLAASAKKLKLLPEGKTVFEQVDIVSIPSPREVVVRASGWTAERVFVFGEEVDDLRTVDYEGLSALNVSATQELSKRLGVQQTQQSLLVQRLADKDAQIATLQSELAVQKRQLAAQGSELDAQREHIVALQNEAGEIAALRTAVVALQAQRVEAPLTTASARSRVEPELIATATQP